MSYAYDSKSTGANIGFVYFQNDSDDQRLEVITSIDARDATQPEGLGGQ
jgi:hypothetical protein